MLRAAASVHRVRTAKPEHEDNCGRDGDDGTDAGGYGRERSGSYNYGSAGIGDGSYTYEAQCIFFYRCASIGP